MNKQNFSYFKFLRTSQTEGWTVRFEKLGDMYALKRFYIDIPCYISQKANYWLRGYN